MRLKRYLSLALAGAVLSSSLSLGVVHPVSVSALGTVTDSQLDKDEESTEPDYLSILSTSADAGYNQYVYLDLDPDYVQSVKYRRRDVSYVSWSASDDSDYSAKPEHSIESEANQTVSLSSGDNYTYFNSNGYYEVFITYKNGSKDVKRFWIDRTAPTITGDTGVEGSLNKVFSFTVGDKDSGVKTVNVGNRSLDTDNTGEYKLSVEIKAEENGENIVFNEDGSIKYGSDGEIMKEKVYVTKANFKLNHPNNKVINWSETLDTPYKNASAAKKSLEAVLSVTVTDVAGNSATKELGWDNVAPVVSGVKANTSYRGTKKITVYDSRLKSVVISKKKNKTASASNTKFEFDKAAKKLTLTAGGSTKSFTISDEEFKEGTTQKDGSLGDYKVNIRRNHQDTVFSITYKGSSLAEYNSNSGLAYNAENGIFSVKAVDRNGNENNKYSNIRADSAAPKIKGFTSGKVYKKSITVTASDAVSGVKSITVNGKKISKNGKTYKKSGSYSVVATDKAGNTAIKSFRIQ